MSQTIRIFIREVLSSRQKIDSSFSDTAILKEFLPLLLIKGDAEYRQPYALDKSIAGKRFSFTPGGEPEFQVVADNIDLKQLIVCSYPFDHVEILLPGDNEIFDPASGDTEYGEGEGAPAAAAYFEQEEGARNLTAEKFIKNLDAKELMSDSVVLKAALEQKDGWIVDEILYGFVTRSIESANFFGNKSLGNVFLMARNPAKLNQPAVVSTETGLVKLANFECVDDALTVLDSLLDIATWNTKAMSDIKWARNAACFYEYANSPEKAALAAGIALAIGAIFAPETLGASFFAALGVAGSGATVQDALCRVPVIIWACVTKRWKFAAANLVYLIIIIAFESLAKFKSAKSGLKAAQITGVDAVKQSGKLELGAATLMSHLKNAGVPTMSAEKFAEVVKRASSGGKIEKWFIEDEKLAGELYEAIDKMQFWSVTKITIMGVILQLVTGMFGDAAADSIRTELDPLIEGEFSLDILMKSDKELLDYVTSLRLKYPER